MKAGACFDPKPDRRKKRGSPRDDAGRAEEAGVHFRVEARQGKIEACFERNLKGGRFAVRRDPCPQVEIGARPDGSLEGLKIEVRFDRRPGRGEWELAPVRT